MLKQGKIPGIKAYAKGEKKRTRRVREKTHQRDGRLIISNPTGALDTFSAYHGRSVNGDIDLGTISKTRGILC